jgi:hypothetical protein
MGIPSNSDKGRRRAVSESQRDQRRNRRSSILAKQ